MNDSLSTNSQISSSSLNNANDSAHDNPHDSKLRLSDIEAAGGKPAAELNVLFVIDAIRERNGVGTYFVDLIEHLKEPLGRVELVAPSMKDPHPCQGLSLVMPGDFTQRVYFPHLRRLTRLILEQKPDVLVIPGPGWMAMGAFWIAGKLKIPVCVTHQTDWDKMAELYWSKTMEPYARRLLNWANNVFFNGCVSAAAVNEAFRDDLVAKGVPNVHVVGTTLAPEFIKKPVSPALERRLNKVLFIGRLAPEKNLDHFLDLSAQRPDLRFSVVGDGQLRELVEKHVANQSNLEFLGWCPRAKVLEEIDNHDLLILPSSFESFGTVAMEAMARRRLVMVTEDCGINQWPEMAKGLITIRRDERLNDAVSRLEATPYEELYPLLDQARKAACDLNQESVDHWLEVLQQTAAAQSQLEPPSSSIVFSLLRRMARPRS